MSSKRDLFEMVPTGLVLDGYEVRDPEFVIQARSAASDDVCPDCGVVATSVHSCYQRTLHDRCQRRREYVPARRRKMYHWLGGSLSP